MYESYIHWKPQYLLNYNSNSLVSVQDYIVDSYLWRDDMFSSLFTITMNGMIIHIRPIDFIAWCILG